MSEQASQQGKTVLLVEDDADQLQVLHDGFIEAGMRVLEAHDGTEGLDIALKEHPDVILLDVYMPNMNGIEVLAALRDDAWGKDVPVVILSNHDEAQLLSDALSHGVYDYLIKSRSTLEEVVAKVKGRAEGKTP